MIDCENFITKYYPDATELQKKRICNFLDEFNEFIRHLKIPESLLDRGILCSLFYLDGANKISRTNYFVKKQYLSNIFDVFGIHETKNILPSYEEIIHHNPYKCLFKDLDDVLNFVDTVGNKTFKNYYAGSDLILYKSIIVLGWYGYSFTDMANAKVAGLHNEKNELYISINGKTTYLSLRHFKIVESLALMCEYRTFPKGNFMETYGDNRYIFKSTRRQDDRGYHVTPESLKMKFNRFNLYIEAKFRTSITLITLAKNKIFVDLYNDNRNISIIDKIIELTTCSNQIAQAYLKEYKTWCNVYCKGD